MARTAGDVVLLDSIIRNNDFNTTGNGAVATAVPCAVDVNTSMSLQGVRLGLPSTLGWVPSATYAGISGEVSITPRPATHAPHNDYPSLLLMSMSSELIHPSCSTTTARTVATSYMQALVMSA